MQTNWAAGLCHHRSGDLLLIINHYLFDELGFTGNEENYYDPENSYLNRVMDQRTGNPINLCLLYMLLARRLRLPVAGIGLPGHFICRYQSTAAEIYLDPFNRGKFLTKADCVQYLAQRQLQPAGRLPGAGQPAPAAAAHLQQSAPGLPTPGTGRGSDAPAALPRRSGP